MHARRRCARGRYGSISIRAYERRQQAADRPNLVLLCRGDEVGDLGVLAGRLALHAGEANRPAAVALQRSVSGLPSSRESTLAARGMETEFGNSRRLQLQVQVQL